MPPWCAVSEAVEFGLRGAEVSLLFPPARHSQGSPLPSPASAAVASMHHQIPPFVHPLHRLSSPRDSVLSRFGRTPPSPLRLPEAQALISALISKTFGPPREVRIHPSVFTSTTSMSPRLFDFRFRYWEIIDGSVVQCRRVRVDRCFVSVKWRRVIMRATLVSF